MTVQQLADAWNLKRWRVWKMIREGRLAPYVEKIETGGRPTYLIDPQAVDHRPLDRRKKEKE